MEYVLFITLGALISVLSGFFGVGGGFILTPTLMLFGFSPVEAITTSLLFSIGTSLSGISAHIRLKNIKIKQGLILGLSGMAATQAAYPFVLFLENKGWDTWAVPVFYIILLSYFALSMLKRREKSANAVYPSEHSPSILTMVLIGFFAGFVSTSLGVGGGFIMVPLSVAYLGMMPKKAVGTSLFAIMLIVSAGFLSYASTVSIDYWIGLSLVGGGLIGSQFGAKLTSYFENEDITYMLGALYMATVASVILKLMHLNYTGLVLMAIFVGGFLVRSLVKMQKAKARIKAKRERP
ncbi:sulfite exporter TauE/SafE family protein [Cytobacillus firmus]|uniref:sulfite exporter TauE/SafE family protein n=1 Tax=Cytobacillus firmus TaxID=1399 RepID=UPI00077C8C79|nr:sulfite exporter TauE/SafE family protein [Cytobacillus firmus]MBG9544480.1 permease [Cytobacillus firmus]MBG9549330.1 permease [Cytobacillus firmus]MBG9551909.1 permease [Cytobacillus firmus]MBG9555227.1 permease [Cytobacillus firmus]MBG9573501.1 permease [Cytobacillus firmus]